MIIKSKIILTLGLCCAAIAPHEISVVTMGGGEICCVNPTNEAAWADKVAEKLGNAVSLEDFEEVLKYIPPQLRDLANSGQFVLGEDHVQFVDTSPYFLRLPLASSGNSPFQTTKLEPQGEGWAIIYRDERDGTLETRQLGGELMECLWFSARQNDKKIIFHAKGLEIMLKLADGKFASISSRLENQSFEEFYSFGEFLRSLGPNDVTSLWVVPSDTELLWEQRYHLRRGVSGDLTYELILRCICDAHREIG